MRPKRWRLNSARSFATRWRQIGTPSFRACGRGRNWGNGKLPDRTLTTSRAAARGWPRHDGLGLLSPPPTESAEACDGARRSPDLDKLTRAVFNVLSR